MMTDNESPAQIIEVLLRLKLNIAMHHVLKQEWNCTLPHHRDTSRAWNW